MAVDRRSRHTVRRRADERGAEARLNPRAASRPAAHMAMRGAAIPHVQDFPRHGIGRFTPERDATSEQRAVGAAGAFAR